MPSTKPFFTPDEQELDAARVVAEARPVAKLVAAVVAAALVPLAVRFLLRDVLAVASTVGVLLALAARFVLAVGAGVVLLYVVARANQLAGE